MPSYTVIGTSSTPFSASHIGAVAEIQFSPTCISRTTHRSTSCIQWQTLHHARNGCLCAVDTKQQATAFQTEVLWRVMIPRHLLFPVQVNKDFTIFANSVVTNSDVSMNTVVSKALSSCFSSLCQIWSICWSVFRLVCHLLCPWSCHGLTDSATYAYLP